MTRTLLPPTRKLSVPRRGCALCRSEFDVLHLRWVRGVWVCGPCLHGDAPESEAVIEAVAEADARRDDDLSWQEASKLLRQFDATMHYAGLTARAVGYGVLLWLAYSGRMWADLFTGVFVADFAARLLGIWAECSSRRWHLLVEATLFVVIYQLWRGSGGTLLPETPEGRGIAALGFILVFAVRAVRLGRRLLHGE